MTSPARAMADRAATVFGVPGYSAMWGASTSWYAARWVDSVATGWLALELTGSPAFLALVAACRFFPMLTLGWVGGWLASRFERRQSLRVACVVNIVVMLALTALAATEQIRDWHLIVSTLVLNATWAVFFTIHRILITDVLGSARHATTALAVDQFGFVIANFLFSSISGGLIALAGGGQLAYAAGVACCVAALLFALRVPVARSTADEESAELVRPGAARVDPTGKVALGVIIASVVMNGFAFPVMQLFPLVAREILRVGPQELGYLGSAHAVGSLVGSTSLFALAPRRGGAIFAFGTLGCALGFLLFSFAGSLPVALAVLVLVGCLMSFFGTFQSSLILQSTAPHLRPRTFGILSMAIGTQPIGLFGVGALAQYLGPAEAIRLFAAIAVVGMLVTLVVVPGLRRYSTGSAA